MYSVAIERPDQTGLDLVWRALLMVSFSYTLVMCGTLLPKIKDVKSLIAFKIVEMAEADLGNML